MSKVRGAAGDRVQMASRLRALLGAVAALIGAGGLIMAAPPVHVAAAGSLSANVGVCAGQPGDHLFDGLQGQVPFQDRVPGGANYNCNLTSIGSFAGHTPPCAGCTVGWANMDFYGHCLYWGTGNNFSAGNQNYTFGTSVVDASDPTHPVETAFLTTPAMQWPWESLRVNQARGLLAGSPSGQHYLDVYDVSKDCAHPTLLFSGSMPHAEGHEGWFSPDGTIYYMSCICSVGVYPIDLTDPSHPVEMTSTGLFPGATVHGGSESIDGNTGYWCGTSPDGMLTVDTSQLQAHYPNPQAPLVSSLSIPLDSACQQTYEVTYAGHPYVIQFGELGSGGLGSSSATCQNAGSPPGTGATGLAFAHVTMVDNADKTHPVIAHDVINEVNDPVNCAAVNANNSVTPPGASGPEMAFAYGLFVYGPHQCTPDRLIDPTILACSEFVSGLHVYDIRDPNNVKELAYYNIGTVGTSNTIDMQPARPVIRADLGLIYLVGSYEGLRVLKFENNVYPFAASTTCSVTPDYLFNQYNPDSPCLNVTNTPTGPPLLTALSGLVAIAAMSEAARRRKGRRQRAAA